MEEIQPNRYTAEDWNRWMDRLAADDFVYIDDFISDELFQLIQDYFASLLEEREFSKAAIGSADQRQIESSVRGDFIYWLDREQDSEMAPLFSLLNELVDNIKRFLMLSISDYEFHFALYPPETRYEKHVDQFQGKDNRQLSVLIYLNENWKPGDGGELKIYKEGGEEVLVEPLAKRLLIFRSDTVPHEVMLTHTNRKSLTGWLLRKPASLGNII